VQDARFDTTTLSDPAVGSTPAVRLGTGRTVLVLLHQTDGGGLCGWLPFMPVAAAAGYTTLALDLCRYGAAKCRKVDEGTFTDADQTDPVRMAVRYAREKLRARHVVVMGASMGGSVALMSGVVIDGLAAVVDLSGPLDWPGVEVAGGGSALAVPSMIAMADTEGTDAVTGARRLARRAPAGSIFVGAPTGHGWDLVTDPDGIGSPLAADLFAWLGTHTAS
jgi:dienelactone hydrolase